MSGGAGVTVALRETISEDSLAVDAPLVSR